MDDIGCRGNTIVMSSGIYFNYLDPKVEQINIFDIAKALSNTCRYGGHCEFYSVAEHSIHCVSLAEQWIKETGWRGPHNPLKFYALMHDVAEAYIGDVPKPLKRLLHDYRKIEHNIEGVINKRFKINTGFHHVIKVLDLRMLKAEKLFLFPKDNHTWNGFDSILDVDITLQLWSPEIAELKFLNMFGVLWGKTL